MSMTSDSVGQPVPKGWIMAALMIGVFLSPLNVNFTSVALPTMRTHFGVGVEQATWIGTAYFIPTVVLMPLQAAVGERWGLRRTYILGLITLGAGGVLAALAPSFNLLLGSRVLQGAGWAALYPIALVLIREHFASDQQGSMMGMYESAVGVATIVGPLAAGFIVEFIDWPGVYVVLAAIALGGGVLSLLTIPGRNDEVNLPDFDWAGALTFTASIALMLVAIIRKSPLLFGVGLAVLVVWYALARRAASPFVSPELFSNRRFMAASGAATLRMVVAISALTALPLYFEDVQGMNPSTVGSVMVIYSVFLFLGSWPGGRWTDRAGARRPGMVGYVAMIIGTALLLALDARFSLALVAVALAVRGLGAGLTQAPYARAATASTAGGRGSMVAGLYGTFRYSGLAIGTAFTGILLQSRLAHYGAEQGAGAIPAYRELWGILIVLGAAGLLLTWWMGQGN